MTNSTVNVLFVSWRNTARSILAQACLEQLGGSRFKAFSCGSPLHLGKAPHPIAIQTLVSAGFPLGQLGCRDWNVFTRNGAVRMDFVITLAENLWDVVPRWPGQPGTATWAYPDLVRGSDFGEEVQPAMRLTLLSLRRRIELLVSLPMHGGEKAVLRDEIRDIGYMR